MVFFKESNEATNGSLIPPVAREREVASFLE